MLLPFSTFYKEAPYIVHFFMNLEKWGNNKGLLFVTMIVYDLLVESLWFIRAYDCDRIDVEKGGKRTTNTICPLKTHGVQIVTNLSNKQTQIKDMLLYKDCNLLLLLLL